MASLDNGTVTYLQLVRELKSNHHISLSLLQGGRLDALQTLFKISQGGDFKEDKHLLTKPHLYVSHRGVDGGGGGKGL